MNRFSDTRSRTKRFNDMLDTAKGYPRGTKFAGKCQSGFAQQRTWSGKELILEHTASGKRIWTLDGERITRAEAHEIV